MNKFLILFFCSVCFMVNSMEFRRESSSHLFSTSLLKIHEKSESVDSLKEILRQKISYFWDLAQKNTLDNSDFFSYVEYTRLQDLLMLLDKFKESDKALIKKKAQSFGREVYKAVLLFIGEPSEDLSNDEEW